MNILLVLGSLDEFTKLVSMAKDRGIKTIVCDGYKNGPAKKIADKFYDIPVTEIDKIVDICKKENVNGIITSFSDLLFECMVKIADKANLKCYFKPSNLPYYRDKSVMKKMFDDLNIPSSNYTTINKEFKDNELESIKFPVVSKPIDKYGSRGIFVLHSIDEIRNFFDKACDSSEIKRLLIEEYNDGYEFNMMSWIIDGKVHVISIADREKTWISKNDIPISTRNVYPSRLYNHVEKEATEILQKIADYAGQRDGSLSIQFFWSENKGLSVCEVAGRFLGYEHELVELAGGLCLEEVLLDYVYDEENLKNLIKNHDPRLRKQYAVLYFHGKETFISDQSIAYQIAKRPDVIFNQIFYKEGEQITQHGPNPYVARYYITGPTRKDIDNTTIEIFNSISVKDSNGQEILYKNKITEYTQ